MIPPTQNSAGDHGYHGWSFQHLEINRMVYPNRMLGQQLLDAGIVQFAPGSQLDVQKSMGSSPKNMVSRRDLAHHFPGKKNKKNQTWLQDGAASYKLVYKLH